MDVKGLSDEKREQNSAPSTPAPINDTYSLQVQIEDLRRQMWKRDDEISALRKEVMQLRGKLTEG
jgi:hypothetical protein